MRQKPDGHVIVSKEEQESILNEAVGHDLNEDSKDSAFRSDISNLPSPTVEKHQIEVDNLKWQIQYEKKLHDQTSKLLEEKVASLMATQKELEEKIVKLNQTIDE